MMESLQVLTLGRHSACGISYENQLHALTFMPRSSFQAFQPTTECSQSRLRLRDPHSASAVNLPVASQLISFAHTNVLKASSFMKISSSPVFKVSSACSSACTHLRSKACHAPSSSAAVLRMARPFTLRACTETVDVPGQIESMKMLRQQAQEFVVPAFTPPFTHKLNPLLEEAYDASKAWALHNFGTFIDPDQVQKLCQANLHHLSGCIYSTSSVSHLEWALEYFLLLYVWDDELLARKLDTSLERLVQLYVEVILVMMSSFPHDKILRESLEKYLVDDPDRENTTDLVEEFLARAVQHPGTALDKVRRVSQICSAFQNLWSRATSVMPEEWSLRFARIVQRDMLATFIEARNLRQNIVPSVSSYIAQRRETGFTESTLVSIDYIEEVFLPDIIYYSPPMQRLLQATVDAVCWHNDLWSFPKELLDGESYNLVFLISKQRACSYNKAGEIVHEMMVDRCEEMQIAASELRENSKGYNNPTRQVIEKYITCCNNWISSTHAFHSNSSRFRLMQL